MIPIFILECILIPGNLFLPIVSLVVFPFSFNVFTSLANGNVFKGVINYAFWAAVGLAIASPLFATYTQIRSGRNRQPRGCRHLRSYPGGNRGRCCSGEGGAECAPHRAFGPHRWYDDEWSSTHRLRELDRRVSGLLGNGSKRITSGVTVNTRRKYAIASGGRSANRRSISRSSRTCWRSNRGSCCASIRP